MDVAKRGVIIGMALGDGYVRVRTRYDRKLPREERTLRVLHGPSQRAYCEWKAERLAWALGCRPMKVSTYRNGPGGRYTAYQFSKNHSYFGQVHRWLYPNGKKLFTRKVLDMLTPEGLAIWYMDDGHARKNTNSRGFVSSVATDIATQCTEVEAQVIVDWLQDRFGLEFKVRCNKRCSPGKQFYIQANTSASNQFASIIAPHVPECMLYKLAHVAALSSHECRAPVSHCFSCDTPVYDDRRGGLCVRCYTRERTKRLRAAGDDIV
ncbi:hypothetical protein [Lamprobacter sp.]|uniref:hypothetical protein n=1 Tax=Lamprobacter sp. TaxID=3100796 RepID=UPI003A4D45F8